MGAIATAYRHMAAAGMDPEAIERAICEMEEAALAAPVLTARQERNRRYYESKRLKASEKRLKASESDGVLKPSESVLKRLNSDAPEPPLARVRDITSNSEIAGLAVVDVCAGERANDDWPKGDHVRLLVEAAASGRLDPAKSPGLATTAGRIAAWKRDGASWVHDVLPAVQAAVRKTGPPIGTWKYFDSAIAQSIADNRQALQIPPARHAQPADPDRKHAAFIERYTAIDAAMEAAVQQASERRRSG